MILTELTPGNAAEDRQEQRKQKRREYMREYRQSHAAELAAANRKYRAANKARVVEWNARYYQRKLAAQQNETDLKS